MIHKDLMNNIQSINIKRKSKSSKIQLTQQVKFKFKK